MHISTVDSPPTPSSRVLISLWAGGEEYPCILFFAEQLPLLSCIFIVDWKLHSVLTLIALYCMYFRQFSGVGFFFHYFSYYLIRSSFIRGEPYNSQQYTNILFGSAVLSTIVKKYSKSLLCDSRQNKIWLGIDKIPFIPFKFFIFNCTEYVSNKRKPSKWSMEENFL